jgi:hypothetical protein
MGSREYVVASLIICSSGCEKSVNGVKFGTTLAHSAMQITLWLRHHVGCANMSLRRNKLGVLWLRHHVGCAKMNLHRNKLRVFFRQSDSMPRLEVMPFE